MIKITKNTRFIMKKSGTQYHPKPFIRAVPETDLTDYLSDGWVVTGINECDPEKLKYRRKWIYPDYNDWGISKDKVGIPEGKHVWYSYHNQPPTYKKGVDSCIQRYRDKYKQKLYSLLKKIKELESAGLDRKTAIKVAKSCACSH